ncbi:MAG: hypothetical protein PHI89_05605 [Thiovulaceae bacterium]|nr:hypothetical protein [Sulfurimonadaceae bacterium]
MFESLRTHHFKTPQKYEILAYLLKNVLRITTVDTSTIPDYTVDETTRLLPTLRGYGKVYNSFINYNTDTAFKQTAQEFATDLVKSANEFELFLQSWSGYDKLVNDIKNKYNIQGSLHLNDLDKKVWIAEHFLGVNTYINAIEANLESLQNPSKNP